ncbi:MAG: hypothetical protein HY727_15135 [Candidatus Rokubacteria bacterium]|nr:hypothetical protein [Candidatus Rokubacteria bacterium]
MTWLGTLTLLIRLVEMTLVFIVAVDLWRAARRDGALVRGFAWFFTLNAATMGWYVLASLVELAGHRAVRLWMVDHALPMWLALLAATLALRRALR